MRNRQSSDFAKKLLTLVMPIAFQQFMLALVSASDALMLGVMSQDALSAVSLLRDRLLLLKICSLPL